MYVCMYWFPFLRPGNPDFFISHVQHVVLSLLVTVTHCGFTAYSKTKAVKILVISLSSTSTRRGLQ